MGLKFGILWSFRNPAFARVPWPELYRSHLDLCVESEALGYDNIVYIELSEDRAVTPAWQRQMYDAVPCDEVRSIAASHSAYFSKPDALAEHISAIAAARRGR